MRALWRRILELVRWRRLDSETVDELEHHVALLVDAKVRAGIDAAEARRQARLELGSVQAARQELAEGRAGVRLEQMTRDVLDAARVLKRTPGTTALSVATIGVGVGASAVLFALVSAVVLRPLPYPDPDRLVSIYDTNPDLGVTRAGSASGNIEDWRRRATLFEGIAGYYAMGRTLSTDGDAEVLITAQVSRDFFPLLKVPALLGRTFTEDETLRGQFNNAAAPVGSDPIVVIAHRLWQQRFGGDPGVIGRSITLERRTFRVVGVMPPRFAIPHEGVQVWIPWDLSGDRPRDQHYLGVVARVSGSAPIERAEEQLNGVALALGVEHPTTNRGWGVRVIPLEDDVVGGVVGVLWILLAAVGLLLLAACANVSLLSLMRGLERSDAAAIRLALGASPRRLFRQFFSESVLLAVAGGLLGAGLAAIGVVLLPRLVTDLPRLDDVAIDYRALLFIVGVTGVAAVASGLPAAWRGTHVASLAGLPNAWSRSTASRARHRLRDVLVAGQVALAVVLLAGSALLLRSFLRLSAVECGFDPRGVLVAPVFLDMQAYGSGERVRSYYAKLFQRLAAIPGVRSVGGATTVPTSPLGPDFERPVWPEDAGADPTARMPASVRMITPGYLSTLRIGLADGRSFDDRDRPDAPRVVMVSESLARRLWHGRRAVGRRLFVDYSTAGTYPYEVVGVVRDVRFRGPRSEPQPEIYLPHAQRSYLILNVVLRSDGDPRSLVPAVRGVMKALDPQKPAQGLYPLEELVTTTFARDRQTMLVLMLFAAGAASLSGLSIYGVLSHRVRERSREIGIRVAMGADPLRVIGWVAGLGLRLIAAGVAIGMAAAWALSGTLSGMLFGVPREDPVTALVVVLLVTAVGLVATLVPAFRATRVDPLVVLRS